MKDETYEFLKKITGKSGDDLIHLLENDPELLRYVSTLDTLKELKSINSENPAPDS